MSPIYKPVHYTSSALSLPELHRLAESPDQESLSRLRKQSYPALRLLIRAGDSKTLMRLIDLGVISKEQCKKILAEELPSELSIRLALLRGTSEDAALPEADPPFIPDGLQEAALRFSLHEPAYREVLGHMSFRTSEAVFPAGTDGHVFFMHPQYHPVAAESDQIMLHMVMHLLFHHHRRPAECEARLWDLACDIAAQAAAAEIYPSQVRLPASADLPTGSASLLSANAYQVYDSLIHLTSNAPLSSLETLFHLDDHSQWNHSTAESDPLDDSWAKLQHASLHRRKSRRGTAPGSRQDKILIRESAKYDFRHHLRRYCTVREEMQLDLDSFDFIFYHYGLLHNSQLPLFEPLEYTEANKVEQLVIAIDTSGSCDLATVQRFLEEVHGILTKQENFFRKMEVHLIQCDSAIQHHIVIRSSEEWEKQIEHMTIFGRGGTDFTPVFRRIHEMQTDGKLAGLRGLLYFTDGDGVYPSEAPPYETAFVFPDERFHKLTIPPWIIPLILDPT